MSWQLEERPASPVRGCQVPRIISVPAYTTSSGPEAVEFCASVGLYLDPWQGLCLEYGLAEDPADRRRWAAFEVGVEVARQNGKGELLMAREVVGLFLFRQERLLLHSAHEFRTAREAFLRILALITNCDRLRRRVKVIRQANGEEGIELIDGTRLRFLARSTSSGRGFTGDVIVLDEAQILSDGPMQAMLPTLSARPNPQVWYALTAGNQHSTHLARVRRRALAGGDPTLAYMGWCVDPDNYNPADPADWAIANPALGIRISEDYIARERSALSPEGFASERLGVGDWPSDEGFSVISADKWAACADPTGSRPDAPVCFAVDVNPERSGGAIAVAGRRSDGRLAVEIADQRPGLDWIVPRMAELVAKHKPLSTVVDRGGPAGTLVAALEAADVEVLIPTSQEVAQAAEGLYDAVGDATLVHQGDHRLDAAVAGARQRPIGEAWGWARRTSSTDISPLVAASFALWGYGRQVGEHGEPMVLSFADLRKR